MRSSVSVILSDPVPDNTMAFPDYAQTCADHARYTSQLFAQMFYRKQWDVGTGQGMGVAGPHLHQYIDAVQLN